MKAIDLVLVSVQELSSYPNISHNTIASVRLSSHSDPCRELGEIKNLISGRACVQFKLSIPISAQSTSVRTLESTDE